MEVCHTFEQGSTRLQMLVTDSATQASIAKYDAERKHGEENTQHAGNAVSKSVLINGQAQPWVRAFCTLLWLVEMNV